MYKLILVDDEEEVRKGIVQKIDWKKCGFEIAGEAENGREALEIVEKVVPDVILADIKMPFMDGLELSEVLRERFPSTKIVIITGFDEFEYAQKAVRLNVIEYVLKPISSEELTNILVKIKVKIDEEIAQKRNIQILKEHYRRSLPILREKFLASLITGKLNKKEICEKTNYYGLNLNGDEFVVSIISIDNGVASTNRIRNYSQVGSNFESDEDFDNIPEGKELLNFSLLRICKDIVNKHNLGMAFLYNDHIVIISVHDEGDREPVVRKSLSVLEEIRQGAQKFLGITVTAGIGMVCRDIVQIKHSYESALTALDYRLVLGGNRIICIEDLEPQCSQKIVFDEIKERTLISCIKVGTAEDIKETVETMFKEVTDAKTSFKDYQIYLMEMLTAILKAAKGLNTDTDHILGTNCNLFIEMYKLKAINEVKNWFIEICLKIRSYISNHRHNTCKLLVKKAIDYVHNHYHESDITIDKICRYLYISPTYFSSIFKKEMKMTFINYLTHIRMEAAKELLRTTDLKSFEIAAKVGYSEPNYFSYCFKKNFGISPTQYRNNF